MDGDRVVFNSSLNLSLLDCCSFASAYVQEARRQLAGELVFTVVQPSFKQGIKTVSAWNPPFSSILSWHFRRGIPRDMRQGSDRVRLN